MKPLGFRKLLKETDSYDVNTKAVKKIKSYKKSDRQKAKLKIKNELKESN